MGFAEIWHGAQHRRTDDIASNSNNLKMIGVLSGVGLLVFPCGKETSLASLSKFPALLILRAARRVSTLVALDVGHCACQIGSHRAVPRWVSVTVKRRCERDSDEKAAGKSD
jgi:hypothetical protein